MFRQTPPRFDSLAPAFLSEKTRCDFRAPTERCIGICYMCPALSVTGLVPVPPLTLIQYSLPPPPHRRSVQIVMCNMATYWSSTINLTLKKKKKKKRPALTDSSTDTPSFKLAAKLPACPSPRLQGSSSENRRKRAQSIRSPAYAVIVDNTSARKRTSPQPGFTRFEDIVPDLQRVPG